MTFYEIVILDGRICIYVCFVLGGWFFFLFWENKKLTLHWSPPMSIQKKIADL